MTVTVHMYLQNLQSYKINHRNLMLRFLFRFNNGNILEQENIIEGERGKRRFFLQPLIMTKILCNIGTKTGNNCNFQRMFKKSF